MILRRESSVCPPRQAFPSGAEAGRYFQPFFRAAYVFGLESLFSTSAQKRQMLAEGFALTSAVVTPKA